LGPERENSAVESTLWGANKKEENGRFFSGGSMISEKEQLALFLKKGHRQRRPKKMQGKTTPA